MIDSPMAALDEAVEFHGGVTNLALVLGVRQSAISNWKARGSEIDPRHCVVMEQSMGRPGLRKRLRPKDWHLIWPELAQPAPSAPADKAESEAAHG